ncbi:MAG: glycosyltransferase [Paludibacter sp.]|nr:glycosyltransferase [Bacteroidales bacterium]MCM1069712.1 glycosyltransferase [Prevotella sp.]MCM1354380.1 glycosyltransferase [Bacteroides sp.]MCM1441927.1 glycosyltransferase [Muribaculum sp.]MCM1482578.1 glycosyltransferase [Paludibacter sp.]
MKNINCFIPFQSEEQVKQTVANLKDQELVNEVYFLQGDIRTTANMRYIAQHADTPYTLVYTKYTTLSFVLFALERMEALLEDSGAAMVYADHFNQVGDERTNAPVIDYQQGALRDDFDFGSVLFFRTDALKEAVARMDTDYQYAGLYDLRLKVSQKGQLEHINEYLYYDVELDNRKSGEKLFDYVDPKNRGVQIEMEQACTQHLKDIGGYLAPSFKDVDLQGGGFEYEASVVIPCKNRVRTIGTAIRSALAQVVKAPYKYNVIVVDDNSEDGSVDIIKEIVAEGHDNLVYIAQDKSWHAIGGNWNVALHHPKCGRFAIQLDSDDTYYDENTVQKFIDAFHEQNCAMVVGTYRMTDFDGNILPPGVIDHREWTPDNGRNNALRINGLGAPRGFYTPMLRTINFPTTKYGEDYAVGLRVSREYQIGRIYDVVYNCRRWDDNSDANCDTEAMNRNNLYKDRIRTWELKARIALNNKQK